MQKILSQDNNCPQKNTTECKGYYGVQAVIGITENHKELERRGHRFVRYADDCLILCKSKRGANRTKESIVRFIEGELFLKVNKEKTKVGYIKSLTFLGYCFYVNKGICKLSLSPKSKSKLILKLKELTSRSKCFGYERCKIKLKEYIQGWVGYYKLADMKGYLQSVESGCEDDYECVSGSVGRKPRQNLSIL